MYQNGKSSDDPARAPLIVYTTLHGHICVLYIIFLWFDVGWGTFFHLFARNSQLFSWFLKKIADESLSHSTSGNAAKESVLKAGKVNPSKPLWIYWCRSLKKLIKLRKSKNSSLLKRAYLLCTWMYIQVHELRVHCTRQYKLTKNKSYSYHNYLPRPESG